MCDRFALAGFDALAPDLYKGTVVPYHDTDAAGKAMNSLDFMRDRMTLPAQFGFAQPSNQRTQVSIIQMGNIVPGDFEHNSKLRK